MNVKHPDGLVKDHPVCKNLQSNKSDSQQKLRFRQGVWSLRPMIYKEKAGCPSQDNQLEIAWSSGAGAQTGEEPLPLLLDDLGIEFLVKCMGFAQRLARRQGGGLPAGLHA